MRFPDGSLAGIVRRNTTGDGPKYRYPTGFRKSDFLFNYDPNHRSVVVLHEGAMDVVASWEAAYDAFGIYGARLSEAQATLLQKVSPDLVVCAFDNDRAGRAATEQVRELISDWVRVEEFPWGRYSQYKDIAELPITIRSRALDTVAS
jgi:DNA primase